MSNSFSKEERVAFEDILEGFNDALVLSRNVSVYNTDSSMMERTNNVIYRPQPYIAALTRSFPSRLRSASRSLCRSFWTRSSFVMPCKKAVSVKPRSRNWPPTSTSPS